MDSIDLILGEVRVMRAENREDINKLHTKIDKVYEQALQTNGRVNKLDDLHKICPIKEHEIFIERIKQQQTKQYKLGDFVINIAATTSLVLTIIGIILFFKK